MSALTPEQAQETAQGQTTETNVQPEQTTVAGEQGVSTNIEAQKADIERRRQEELNNVDLIPLVLDEELARYNYGRVTQK